jgi:hypothetical protein
MEPLCFVLQQIFGHNRETNSQHGSPPNDGWGGVFCLVFITHIFYKWAHNVRQCEICYISNVQLEKMATKIEDIENLLDGKTYYSTVCKRLLPRKLQNELLNEL